MRRIASVFSSKRDKGDSGSTSLRSQSNLTLPSIKFKRPQPALAESPTTSVLSTPQLSSGASSNGSASLQTPEVDEQPKRSWKSWLSRGKTGTIKSSSRGEWQPSPPPLLQQPPAPNRKAQRQPDSEEEDDSDSDEESSTNSVSQGIRPIMTSTSSTAAQARRSLQVTIQNSLRHRIVASPFLHLPDTPSYPRSCHPYPSLPHPDTVQLMMHKRRLLRRLLDTKAPLTATEESSIMPFSQRVPTLIQAATPLPYDEAAPPKRSQITQYSRSLHSWVTRPCFEERCSTWVPSANGIVCQNITGTKFGVAALEFSEALEAMVDFTVEITPRQQHFDEPLNTEEPETPSPSSSSSSLQHSRTNQYVATSPSPLRNEHSPSTAEADANKATSSAPVVKRGVRFAEDDKEDTIPIGYVLRIKKQKEQKAKFLREQKEQRLFDEERRRVEAERRERDKMRVEWEKERQIWEQERKAMEEEKRQRLYQAEVAAARERREAQRMGVSSRAVLSSSSYTSLKEPERHVPDTKSYLRPAYDGSRRQPSEPGATSSSSSPHSSSPPNSRPSSVVGHSPRHGATTLAPPPSHRPPSVYSNHSFSSSEDVRAKDSTRKRNSMASVSSVRPTGELNFPYATWSSSSANLHSYPIPPVPPLPIDMPLLPPTAPFMLHQYPRRKSSSPGPSRTASNDSLEKINLHTHGQSSPQRLPSSSPHRPTHQRSSSGDQKRMSFHSVGHDDRGRSLQSSERPPPSSMNRGRRPRPSHSQSSSSPWTAPPSQFGQHGMPPNLSSNTKNDNMALRMTRRQTTIS